jgi:hypothetical protein
VSAADEKPSERFSGRLIATLLAGSVLHHDLVGAKLDASLGHAEGADSTDPPRQSDRVMT